MFEKIKHFYELGLYTADMVRAFAARGIITEEQYVQIVGGEA